MADFREISQEYALGAIKAAILVNGGAAVAVLSQLSALSSLASLKATTMSMLVFVFGVLFATSTWGFGFLSTRHVDRAQRGEDRDYSVANIYMTIGLLMFFASLLCFLIGALILVVSVQ